MAAPHTCANCKQTTSADSWVCEDCTRAVAEEVARLTPGQQRTFAWVDEARQRALARRAR